MPDWMIYSGYVLCGLAGFVGLLIFFLVGTLALNTPRDPMDKIGYPICALVGCIFLFASFWICKAVATEHPWKDDLQYRVRIGSDNEAVFLGGQAEKYSMEYRLFRRWKGDSEDVWLNKQTENQ